jgi:hypothetical protein
MDYYTGSKMWRTSSVNGHSNSTLGGIGTNKREIFDANRAGTARLDMATQDGIAVNKFGTDFISKDGPWANVMNTGSKPCNTSTFPESTVCPPRNTGWYGGTPGSITKGADYATWYGGTTPVTNAHRFSCSKCHSPHATGLPGLLITNCMDKGLATWSANTGRVGPNVTSSKYRQAPNDCHYKSDSATDPTTRNSGWNSLAPKQKSN